MKLVYVNESGQELIEKNLQKILLKISQELIVRKVLSKENLSKELSLVFLDKNLAKRINWQYRQKDYATDVLSFASDDPDSFGELVLCPEVIVEQAKQHKLSFELEMTYMIIHGILHLLGFDHERSPDEEKKMFKIQDEIFEQHFRVKEATTATKGKAKSTKAKTKKPLKKKIVKKKK